MNTTTAPLPPLASPHAPLTSDDALREALKRCSPATLEAARAFRATGDYAHLPAIVTGVIARFVERELREKLFTPPTASVSSTPPTACAAPDAPSTDDLRLVEDLGLDSLTMMEIVILTEDVLPVSINNEELRHLRTFGNVKQFIECKLRGLPLPASLTAQRCTACASAVPNP